MAAMEAARDNPPLAKPGKTTRQRTSDPLPPGMPRGPWPHPSTGEMTIPEDFKKYCTDQTVGGGGWGVHIRGGHDANSCHGAQRVIRCCTGDKSKKGECGWQVTIERCVEGWAIWAYHQHSEGCPHDHDLVKGTAEANAHPSLREFPEDLLATALTMRNTVRTNEARPLRDFLSLIVLPRTLALSPLGTLGL